MPLAVPEQELVLARGEHGVDQLRRPSSTERAMMPRGRGFEKAASSVFLTMPLAGGEQHEAAGVEVAHGAEGGDLLARLQLHQVHDGLALALRPDVGDLVDLQPVDPAAVGEDQDVGVGGGDEEVRDEVLVLGPHPHAAAPARAAARGSS